MQVCRQGLAHLLDKVADYYSAAGEQCNKHRQNREKLPREHLIGCGGVKLFLLKYVAITTVATATVT